MSGAITATATFLAIALVFSRIVWGINAESLKRVWWLLGAFLFALAMLCLSFIVMFVSWWKASTS